MIKKLILAAFMAFALDAYSETSIKDWLLTLKASSEQAAAHIGTAWKHLTSEEKIRVGNAVTNHQDTVDFGDINISGTTIKRSAPEDYWKSITIPSLSVLDTAWIGTVSVNNSISDQSWGNTKIAWDYQRGLVFSTSPYLGVQTERAIIGLDGNVGISNNLLVSGYGQAGGILLSNGTVVLPVNGATMTEPGQIGWDSVWQTPSIRLNDHVTGQIFMEDFVFVTNITDIAIPDGAAVYAIGVAGNYQCVYLATSTNILCRTATKGLTTEPIPPHGSGHVTVRGGVNFSDTSMFEVKDVVYLSTTPGVLTSVLPQFPEDQISMGSVDIVSSTTGRISVNIRAIDRKEENLVGTLYAYNSKLSDINGYHLLSNEFESVEGYTTYTTNGVTNGQTVISYLSPVSRVTTLAGGVSATIRIYSTINKDGNNPGGLTAKLSVYTTNMTVLASYTSGYLGLDQNEIKRDVQISILSNQTFTVPVRFSLDLIAQHTSATRNYSVFAEDGRPLSVEVPLPSGQFAFRSDLENYVLKTTYNAGMSNKLDVSNGTATNLTVVKPLIVKGTDHSNQDVFFPQSNGVQVVGDPDQDLFYGLGGTIGKPAWWMQTYRNENSSGTNSPEFMYFSNARIAKDIMILSEGGRMSVNKTSNILDYHSDYQGYQMGALNDLKFSGVYSYSKQRKYDVYISSLGNPDRWSWKKSYDNGLTWVESGVTNECSTTNMVVENGVRVSFDYVTGHNLHDAWIRTGYAQLPPATVHMAPQAYEEIGFTTNYNNESGWEDLTYTMASTVHSSDRYALTNTSSAIYLGRGIKMNSTFYNLAEYGVGLALVFEYWNGSTWMPITVGSHHLSDGTANFTQSGQVSWDKFLISDWKTGGVTKYSGEDLFWLRVRTSVTPSIPAKIKNITPQGKVRFGIMGRQYDDDYSFYVDGFGSSYQIKGYQSDTGSTFEANQLITAGAVNKLLDAFRTFNLYFSTNFNPVSAPNRLLTSMAVPVWKTTTALSPGTNLVACFVSTNTIGSTLIPAGTKYSTTYYASKTTSQGANAYWELIEVGDGITNVIASSAETPLVQTTPTIISTSVYPATNFNVQSSHYLGVRVYGIRPGNAVSMVLYGGGNYGSSLSSPSVGTTGGGAGIIDAPLDGIAYGRKNQTWVQVLEPNGSGASLSGVVKETDPKYVNALTNETDSKALSSLADFAATNQAKAVYSQDGGQWIDATGGVWRIYTNVWKLTLSDMGISMVIPNLGNPLPSSRFEISNVSGVTGLTFVVAPRDVGIDVVGFAYLHNNEMSYWEDDSVPLAETNIILDTFIGSFPQNPGYLRYEAIATQLVDGVVFKSDTTNFATAAQGLKADTAIQSAYGITVSSNNFVVGVGTRNTTIWPNQITVSQAAGVSGGIDSDGLFENFNTPPYTRHFDFPLTAGILASLADVTNRTVNQIIMTTNAMGMATNMRWRESSVWKSYPLGGASELPTGVITNGYLGDIGFTNNLTVAGTNFASVFNSASGDFYLQGTNFGPRIANSITNGMNEITLGGIVLSNDTVNGDYGNFTYSVQLGNLSSIQHRSADGNDMIFSGWSSDFSHAFDRFRLFADGGAIFPTGNVYTVNSGTITNQVVVSPVGSNQVSQLWKGSNTEFQALVVTDPNSLYVVSDDNSVYSDNGIYHPVETYNVFLAPVTTIVSLAQDKTVYRINVDTNAILAVDSSAMNLTDREAKFDLELNVSEPNLPISFVGFEFSQTPDLSATGIYRYVCNVIDNQKVIVTIPTITGLAYVPYTGATGTVDIGTNSIKIGGNALVDKVLTVNGYAEVSNRIELLGPGSYIGGLDVLSGDYSGSTKAVSGTFLYQELYTSFTNSVTNSMQISDQHLSQMLQTNINPRILSVESNSLEFSEWLPTNTYVKVEEDPIAGPRITELENHTNNWNQAYSWGNHAVAGYLLISDFTEWKSTNTYVKTEVDPHFFEWLGTNTYPKTDSGASAFRYYNYGNPETEESPEAWFTFDAGTITAFDYVAGREKVVIPWEIGGVPVVKIGNSAFSGDSITNVYVPRSVTNIGNSAFMNCASLAAVYYSCDVPVEGVGIFLSAPGVTNYIVNLFAKNWGTEYGSRPVVRASVYSDSFYQGGQLVATTQYVNQVISSTISPETDPYMEWTGQVVPSGSSATITAAHGSLPYLILTRTTTLSIDSTGFGTSGVSRISLSVQAGSYTLNMDENITLSTEISLPTTGWGTILLRRVSNDAWKAAQL